MIHKYEKDNYILYFATAEIKDHALQKENCEAYDPLFNLILHSDYVIVKEEGCNKIIKSRSGMDMIDLLEFYLENNND
jgi:hypothetical protein